MITRQPGSSGPQVSALGLGCMGMSDSYGAAERDESIATIRAALDVALTPEDLAPVERAVPMGAASGSRYDAGQMVMLDSERSGGASATARA